MNIQEYGAFRPTMALVMVVLCLSATAFAQSGAVRGDQLKYACLAESELSGAEVDDAWCQCQNDYYADLLTDADWSTYTQDYYALLRYKNDGRSTPPNSYERAVKLGNAHCTRCKANNYQGCLIDDGNTPSTGAYARLLADLRDGQFEAIDNTVLFKGFFVNYLVGYSDYCGAKVDPYVERTVTWTEYRETDYTKYKTGETTTTVRIAPHLYDTWLDYSDTVSSSMSQQLISGYLEAAKRRELPFALFQNTVNRIVQPVVFMREHLENRCGAKDVSVVYDNLQRYVAGQSPIVVPEYVAERERKAAERAERINAVKASVAASRARAIEIAAQQRAAAATQPQKTFSCEASMRDGRDAATPIRTFTEPAGESFEGVTGGWQGEFNGERMELAVWSAAMGSGATGFAYFPAYDCLMTAQMNAKRGLPREPQKAFFRLKPVNQRQRPDNCAAMVIDDKDGEIHFFDANGYLTLDDASSMTWYLAGGRMSRLSPVNCSSETVALSPASISADFLSLLRNEAYRDRRQAPMPPGFLESVQR